MKTSHWHRQKERGSNIGLVFLIGVMRYTGPWLVRLLVVPVALYYFLSSSDTRVASHTYLVRLQRRASMQGVTVNLPTGKPGRWLTFRHILTFAQSMVDRVHVWSAGHAAFRYRIEGLALIDRALSNTQHGALFLVSHLGNFDLAMALSESNPKKCFNVVLDTQYTSLYNRFRTKIFHSKQVRFIAPQAITPIVAMDLAARVANGEIVIIAADRIIDANHKNSVIVDFLSAPAVLPSGPYIMAHLLEVPVYYIFAAQQGNGYLIRIELFAQRVFIPRQQRQTTIAQYAQKFATRLERECYDFPLQWYNFYDFWAIPEARLNEFEHARPS